jgi:hypothetical protein
VTYKELVDATMFDRWQENKRTAVERWVRLRHAYVFSYADWPFRRRGPEEVTADAGPSLDLTFGISARPATIRGITDDQGDPLQNVERRAFLMEFAENDQGRPWAYSVVDEVTGDPKGLGKRIYWGPPNDTTRTMKISSTLRLCHLNAAGELVDGNLSSNDDRPIWPEDFDDLLIVGAAATGMKFEADPGWRPLEDDFQRHLTVMVGDISSESGDANPQYARDPL